MFYQRTSLSAVPALVPAPVAAKTIAVPVIQQKIVTRVVYRTRQSGSRDMTASARTPVRNEPVRAAESLAGFTPAHEARLTIIKAHYRTEQ